MGGQIRFESELDKGSIFSFSLDVEVSPLPQTDQLPLDRIRGKRLWLLEPDPFAQASLLALLAEWQLDVQPLTSDDPWPAKEVKHDPGNAFRTGAWCDSGQALIRFGTDG
jgi:two-component system sensor histidine kinase BarA